MIGLKERALRYAKEVLSGEEVAPEEVKIQCQWFLSDLENQESMEFYFDDQEVEQIEQYLKLLNFATGIGVVGESVFTGLVDFQCFFLANVFGWRFKDDKKRYRYRESTLFIPRKNAKTFICAIIFIVLLLVGEPHSEYYSICVDRELAARVKAEIEKILFASPKMLKHFDIKKPLNGRITCNLTKSYYQARTADPKANNAIQPAAFIADEIGGFKDDSNIAAMQSGQLSVANPLRFKITTAYAEDQSIFIEELEYHKRRYKGLITNDRDFALLYYAPEEELWTDKGLLMANPLRIEENYQEIRDNREEALHKESKKEEFLTKHVNHFLPSNAGETYLKVEDVQKCRVDKLDWTGRTVYLGVDLSQTRDNTAVAAAALDDDGKIMAKVVGFIPASRVDEKTRTERIDYRMHINNREVIPCGDMTIDYSVVEEFALDFAKEHNCTVVMIGYDRYNCLSSAQKWENEGYTTVDVEQKSYILHPATKLLQERVLNREFKYEKNKLFEINCQFAKVDYDKNMNMSLNKKKSTKKIDMVVALINAIYLLNIEEIESDVDWVIQI